MASGEELMAEGKLWDYDLPANGDRVTSPLAFESGESSLNQLLGSSSDHSEVHQQQPDYNFTSFLEEFEIENSVAPNPSMVNGHGLLFEENNATLAEGMMDYIPTFVDQLEESLPFSSLVHHIASLSNEKFLEIILETSNMVYDHVGLSTKGNVTIRSLVTLSEDGFPEEQEGGLDNIPCLTAKFETGTRTRVYWTPEMHARFVRAVKRLGGCKSAKPKHILPLMNVEGLSRNHVASRLQLYRNGKC